jgi:hypothetical protein
VCGLDDLRKGLALENETSNIANDIHEGILRGLELHVAVDAVAFARGQSELTGKTRAFDAAGPDEGFGFDDLTALQQDLAGLCADDGRIEHDLAVALLQILFRLCAQGLFEDGKDRRQRLDVEHAHFFRIEEVFAAHHVAVVEQLSDHLDAGKACACDHEGEQPFAFFRISLEGGFVELLLDVRANFHRIFERPEGKGVFGDARYAEEFRFGPHAENDVVEFVGPRLSGGLFGLEIYRFDGVQHHIDAFCTENFLEEHLYRFRLSPPTSYFVQFGHQRVEGTLVDERNFDIFPLAEVLFENFSRPDASISTAENEDFLCCHFV